MGQGMGPEMEPDLAYQHRTEPEPEPVRPGRYEERGPIAVVGVVEVLAVVEHPRLSEPLVVYVPAEPNPLFPGVRVQPWLRFRLRFTRIPDPPAPPEGGPG